MKTPISIVIPTFNNFEYLQPCLQSIFYGSTKGLFKVIVVNNGHINSCDWIQQNDDLQVINTGENYGWEGGLKEGLKHTDSPYIVFMNDDTYVPVHQRFWLNRLIQHFAHDTIGAIGPSSNVVMGKQNIFHFSPSTKFTASFLIGFCMMVRREALERAGGVDDTLPGGDDLDLSIRLKDAGYKLVVDKEVFIYHHGFKTGTRVHGDHTQAGGWNSIEFTEATNHALIKKHGFRKWFECLYSMYDNVPDLRFTEEDVEKQKMLEYIQGDVILDLGCGGNKTVENAIGIDMIPKGEMIDTLKNTVSQADIVADITQPLPKKDVDTIIARHILEHVVDHIQVLRNWIDSLKTGGRLLLAVPNSHIINSIPMNIEHVHSFTPESMRTLLESLGLKIVDIKDTGNNISFIAVAEKI